MRKILAALAFIVLTKISIAQSVSTLMGAKAAGVGYASVTLSDGWSLFNNVAGLAELSDPSVNFTYDLQPFLPNANRAAAAVSVPLKLGVVSGGVFRFGDDIYSEQLASVGYANQLGLASLGIKVGYIQYRAEGFKTHVAWGITAGGIAKLTENLRVGASIQNINQPRMGDNEEKLPIIMSAGISASVGTSLIFLAEVSKDIDYDATVRAGLQYEIVPKLFLRTGFNLQPQTAHGGFGYKIKKLKIDYALTYGNSFLASHQFSVAWQISSREKQ